MAGNTGTLWGRVKSGSKTGFDKIYTTVDKLGPPVNKLSNKLGSEAFWPTTLDKESDKAARILQSFCKDGFYTEDEYQPADGPKQKQKVMKKIPSQVIKNAKGLAIFTTMRTGLWFSGAGGSGILMARKDDGTWSPPSGIMLHTAGLGFMVGIDIYDCVVVINSEKALEAFYKIRCTLGSEISVAAGPVGAGGVLETELHKRQAPIFTYMKSRGFYAGIQIDGTVIIERTDENERFYGQKIPVKDILNGKVRYPPFEVKRLLETIKAAQGDTDVDESILPSEPPPGDFEVVDDSHIFGVPDREDPDPYGLLALEKEGMVVREASTHERASWEQFSFNPSPSSPIHAVFTRSSTDRPGSVMSQRSSWRASTLSNEKNPTTSARPPSSLRASMEAPPTVMTDSSTQTDFPPEPHSPRRESAGSSRRSSKGSGQRTSSMQNVPENEVLASSGSPEREPESARSANGHLTPPSTPPLASQSASITTKAKSTSPATSSPAPEPLPPKATEEAEVSDDEHEDDHIEETVIQSIQTVQPVSTKPTSISINKARLVTVPKRVPPKLPPRNPNRSGPLIIGGSPTTSAEADTKAGSEISSRAGSPVKLDGADAADVTKELEEVKLDDNDVTPAAEEEVRIDGWAKARAMRKSLEEKKEDSAMPGGFD